MKLRVILKIAFKNLWAHRLRTILTVTGVTIGIASIIFLVSLGYGLERLVTDQVASFDAFTIVDVPSANISTIKIDDQAIEKISSFGHIKTTAPVTSLAGRIHKQDNSSTTETVVTAGEKDYWKLSGLVAEKGRMPENDGEIALDKSALTLISEDVNSIIDKEVDIDIIIPSELRTNSADGIKITDPIKLKVVGVVSETKSPIVYIHEDLLKKNDATKYSSLKIKIDDRNNVAALRKQLENIGFSTEYVGDTVNEISQVFSFFRAVLAAFGLIALVVAALGTFNTLTISLLERIREIGLFKALGMKKKDVYKLFLTESLIIGVCGGAAGLLIGWATGQIINQTLYCLAERTNAEKISMFITPWFFSLGVGLFSVLVGFLTGWYPSRRAVKIDPLDALRYE